MFLEIAIDTPLRRVFDYRPAPGTPAAALQPGVRVTVPFGRRRVVGVLLRVKPTSDVPVAKLRNAFAVLDAEPVFDAVLLDLLRWSAEYYRHPIGEVLATALPVALRSGAAIRELIERWRLTELGAVEWLALPARSTRLRALAAALARQATLAELADISPTWRSGLRELVDRGWAIYEQLTVDEPVTVPSIVPGTHALSAEQHTALQAIMASLSAGALPAEDSNARQARFRTFLLHGVTGSGKTEVYLRAIESVLAVGRQALVLVPEIALTPQLIARFQARFAAPLAVLHSALNETERLTAWRMARSGAAPIVIGTRSAVFAPLKNPGIVIVDEEHDLSYKQQEGFRYSARDLAIARAQRHDIPVVLGSATPSLESLERASKQPGSLLQLPTRAGSAQPPRVRVIDLRRHAQTDGIATPTVQSVQQHLQAGGQILLYLNRRGYAPVLFCPGCGWSAACSRCDARMTVHQRAGRLTCHHCGHETQIPESCPSCHESAKPVGEGTERIEDTIARLFPNVPAARIDRDNIRRKGELEATLAQIHSGAVRILIGTQMLAKGHHFPDVTLVVILNADQGLFGTDFRAAERLAQSIVQVSGRAGRAERAGEVLIQTEYPEHPLLLSLLNGGYGAFAEQALREREQAHWPPYARLALLRAEAPSMQEAMLFLHAARERANALRTDSLKVLGPVTAPMPRRAGRYRAQLLLHALARAPLQQLLMRWVPELESLPQARRVRWSLDIDPAELF